MSEHAAIAATFADFRLIKTRKVAQLVMEVPIEKADEALSVLGGLPRSDNERWCGIARLDLAGAQASMGAAVGPDTGAGRDASHGEQYQSRDTARLRFSEMPRSQQAGIRIGDKNFQAWCEVDNADDADAHVKGFCAINSKRELDTNVPAGKRWDDMDARYRQWAGLMAEKRA